MLRVGLTGGIACGKSVVAGRMRELGCHVIDADLVAHEILEPGHAAHEVVVRQFGREVLTTEGKIDRKRLGAIVFADPAKLEQLNRIVHPRVIAEIQSRLVELNHQGTVEIVVVIAALHFEAGFMDWDRMVVVWCWPDQQVERLTARGLSREEALARIARQMPMAEKRRLAVERGYDLIDASTGIEHTLRQVEELVTRLRQLAEV